MEPAQVTLLNRTQKWCSSHVHRALCHPHQVPVSAQAGEVYLHEVGLEGSLLWCDLCFAPSELNLENSPFSHHILIITSLCVGE